MDIGKLEWDEILVGQSLPELVKLPTYAHLFMFSATTWNRHLIHYNAEYARQDGLPDVAVHRALIGNYLVQLMKSWAGRSGKITSVEWNVRSTAIPGDALVCKGIVVDKIENDAYRSVECEIWVEKSDGQLVAPGRGTIELI